MFTIIFRCIILIGGLFSISLSCSQTQLNYLQFGSESELKTNKIYDLHLDPDGELWIAGENGVWLYNGIQFNPIELDEIESFDGSHFKTDQNGKIWLMQFYKGICWADKTSKTLKQFAIEGLNFEGIKGFHFYKNYLYLIKAKELYKIDLQTKTFKLINPINKLIEYLEISEEGFLSARTPKKILVL